MTCCENITFPHVFHYVPLGITLLNVVLSKRALLFMMMLYCRWFLTSNVAIFCLMWSSLRWRFQVLGNVPYPLGNSKIDFVCSGTARSVIWEVKSLSYLMASGRYFWSYTACSEPMKFSDMINTFFDHFYQLQGVLFRLEVSEFPHHRCMKYTTLRKTHNLTQCGSYLSWICTCVTPCFHISIPWTNATIRKWFSRGNTHIIVKNVHITKG